MNRLTLSFWLFLTATTTTGGLLGRYLAAATSGHATPASLTLTPILIAAFGFSATVLIRIVRANARPATRNIAHPAERNPQP